MVLLFSTSGRGPYSRIPVFRTEPSLCFFQGFVNVKAIQLLSGLTVWFSLSEAVLFSNASKYIETCKTKRGDLLRMFSNK